MKLNIFQKLSAALLAAWIASATQAQVAAPLLTMDQQSLIALAARLYPDLFTGGGPVTSAEGYTY